MSVIELTPNIKPTNEVLLFVDYVCVEHYPFKSSLLVGESLADVLTLLGIELPCECHYAFYRYADGTTTMIKEHGMYVRIINSKHLLSNYEQDS